MTPQFYIALCPKCDRCVGSVVANASDRWITAQFLFGMVLKGYVIKPINRGEHPDIPFDEHTCDLTLPKLRTYGVIEGEDEQRYIEWVKSVIDGEEVLGFEQWMERQENKEST